MFVEVDEDAFLECVSKASAQQALSPTANLTSTGESIDYESMSADLAIMESNLLAAKVSCVFPASLSHFVVIFVFS